MKPQTALIEARSRLNKLHSSDYDNIPDWIIVKAVNKAAVEWVRRQVHGVNQLQEGDEETRVRVDDLQMLLKEEKLKGVNRKLFFESAELPKDYLYYKRVLPVVSKGECKRVGVHSTLVEEANVADYLVDWSMQPSFEWRTTFHTLVGDRVRIYTNSAFDVNEVSLMYYRLPKKMDISGYTHEDGSESVEQDLEFKQDIAELILDDAVAIIAGSIESVNQHQINKQRADNNN